jgi:pimeloyl-ACP methyl ester carboxylesterase
MRAEVAMPILVFQGRHDTVVRPGLVERWAAARPNVTLHLLDDDHQLLTSLNLMWTGTYTFLTEVA